MIALKQSLMVTQVVSAWFYKAQDPYRWFSGIILALLLLRIGDTRPRHFPSDVELELVFSATDYLVEYPRSSGYVHFLAISW